MKQQLKRLPLPVLRGLIVLEVAGVAYLAAFALLNAPAFSKQVRFVANNRDLSQDIAGQFVPIEDIPETGQFPYVQMQLNSSAATPSDSPDPAVQSVAAATPSIPSIDPDQFVPNTVTVPRIGVRAPIIEIANNQEKAQQTGLGKGVIHIYGTPSAGNPGNAFYAGHSSDFLFKKGNYKTVFALLPEIKKGDYFIISNDKAMFYFRVVETVITGPKDTTVLERGGKESYASLQTSYPVGTANKRFVAVGKLERSIKLDK